MDVFDLVLPLVLVISAGITLALARSLQAKSRGRQHGLTTTGRCLRITFEEGPVRGVGQGPKTQTSVFGFTDSNGRWVEFEVYGAYVREGSSVTVRYDPANPRQSATLSDVRGATSCAEVAALVIFALVTLVMAVIVLGPLF
ncbi:DUF3592 domain-containing protein [Streptomyces sp. TP-A0874]|uniref:DUF3592 domain-containing protein n=1 Tax=Streptomyces sp. TP-A0874 TaxID=549819 RepID=UPI0008539611|nr:DUF3592 domain-containing protein [Streptomyces sp. TP-A0874]